MYGNVYDCVVFVALGRDNLDALQGAGPPLASKPEAMPLLQSGQIRAIPTADNLISFKVTGEGTLLGVGNGDPNCQESDKAPKRSLFNGLAQRIVQASKTPGTITIEAYTEDWPPPKLPAVRVNIATKKVGLRPTVG